MDELQPGKWGTWETAESTLRGGQDTQDMGLAVGELVWVSRSEMGMISLVCISKAAFFLMKTRLKPLKVLKYTRKQNGLCGENSQVLSCLCRQQQSNPSYILYYSDTINSTSGAAYVLPCLLTPLHKPLLLEAIKLILKVLLTLIWNSP